ncbi:hypothetical protein Tco_1286704 [Tanacetum coccineum]
MDLPRDIPLDRIEVLMYDTKGVKVRKGIMQTKTELTLEQTQQGASDKVLSDTKLFTVMMEILPEPTSNKLCETLSTGLTSYVSFLSALSTLPGTSRTYCAVRNLSRRFFRILPDHRHDEVLKLNNFKKDDYTIFQDQEKYEHVGPKVTSLQEGKRSQDDDKRLYSADDLKKLKDHIQVKLKGTSSSLKSKDHYAYHKIKNKDSRPRAKTEDIHRMLSLRFL